MDSKVIYLTVCSLILLYKVQQSYQLECYVCQNQEDNKNKCAETVKICDLMQEQCLTEVRWGTRPNWALNSQKQHFISKRCATKQECSEAITDKYHKCDRIQYNDWNCTTCCSGDKCNYYVTLSGHSTQPIALVSILANLMVALVFYNLQSKTAIHISN